MAAIFAVLVAGGVLTGMGAVVIDLGRLYVEREELQSGADAASMRVAVNCAKGGTTVCTYASQSPTAIAYAGKNARDTRSDAQICINNVGCPTAATWKTKVTCPPVPAPAPGFAAGSSVEVRTTTRTATGTLVPPSFAQALAGGGYQGKTVGACARVNWGPPAITKVLGLGISECDWRRMTNGGTKYYGPLSGVLSGLGLYSMLGLPAPTPGVDKSIVAAGSLSAFGLPIPNCSLLEPTVPRGYAWLNNPDGSAPDANCMITVKVGDKPRSFLLTAGLVTALCLPRLTALQGKPVLVPIYDLIEPTILTLGPAYRISGFAPFVVTGYSGLIGGLAKSLTGLLGGGVPATIDGLGCGLSFCISGYFTQTVSPVPRPQFGTGKDYGAVVVGRTG